MQMYPSFFFLPEGWELAAWPLGRPFDFEQTQGLPWLG